jgi:hypothetical protein
LDDAKQLPKWFCNAIIYREDGTLLLLLIIITKNKILVILMHSRSTWERSHVLILSALIK